MSTRAAPMICPYVSQMSFPSVSAICFVYKISAPADVYILCFLHCTASVGHVSDELTLALCFAIVLCWVVSGEQEVFVCTACLLLWLSSHTDGSAL